MSVHHQHFRWALSLMIGTSALVAAFAPVSAQDRSHVDHVQHMHGEVVVGPTHPGQEAFGTIQQIVRILEADPSTDWSKVDIGALREHLIDMDEVTLRAQAGEQPVDDGVEITLTGEARTLAAIKRMVPAHTRELAALGWNATTHDRPAEPRETCRELTRAGAGRQAQGAQLHGHNRAGRTP